MLQNLHPQGINIIAHICNDIGGWGKGFVMAISGRMERNRPDHRADFIEQSSEGLHV